MFILRYYKIDLLFCYNIFHDVSYNTLFMCRYNYMRIISGENSVQYKENRLQQDDSKTRFRLFNASDADNRKLEMEILCLLGFWSLVTLGVYNHRIVSMQCLKLPESVSEHDHGESSKQCLTTAGIETLLIVAGMLLGYAVIRQICRSSLCNKSQIESADSIIEPMETAPLLQ